MKENHDPLDKNRKKRVEEIFVIQELVKDTVVIEKTAAVEKIEITEGRTRKLEDIRIGEPGENLGCSYYF